MLINIIMKVQTGEYTVGHPPSHQIPNTPLKCTLHYCEHGLNHSIALHHTALNKYVIIDADTMSVYSTNGTEEEVKEIQQLAKLSYLKVSELDGTYWSRSSEPSYRCNL